MGHLLEVKDLEVKFALRFGDLTAIDGISFTLDKKEKLGLVGESGAGKSVTGFSIINLISKPGYISGGSVMLFFNYQSDQQTGIYIRWFCDAGRGKIE